MQVVYALLDRLREEMVIQQLLNPPTELQSEFGLGKLHGMIFMIEFIREQLQVEMEAQAQRQETFEREF